MPALLPSALLLTLGVAAVALPCAAQSSGARSSHQVVGTVRQSDGTPAARASVVVEGHRIRAVADSAGRFVIPQLAPDTAWIVVTLFGYPLTSSRRLLVGDLPHDPYRPDHAIVDVVLEMKLPPSRPLDITDDTVPDPRLARLARAVGLRPLRDVARRRGDRELRLYVGGGLFVPEDMIVLRKHGAVVTGTMWLWWPSPLAPTLGSPEEREAWDRTVDSTEAAWRTNAADFGCPRATWKDYGPRWRVRRWRVERRTRARMLVCRATFDREPNWVALWDRLDSLGVWTLPDQHELPSSPFIVNDGVSLSVEAFDGRRYRAYGHSNPDNFPWPESKRAAAMLRATMEVLRAVHYAGDTEQR